MKKKTHAQPLPKLKKKLVGGRWEILRPLAEGGMSSVYVARHKVTKKKTALKILEIADKSDKESIGRFQREARSSAEIGHPNIVDIYDADSQDGVVYIVMELLEGEDLDALMARKETSPQEIIKVLERTLEPLATAHDKGFVHRDLKPGNIFITNPGASDETVKILDFGIAREMNAKKLTRTGFVMGTPHYMSPEQAVADKTLGPRADVWSLGIMMYEALAGVVPFDAENPAGVLIKICTEAHKPLREHVADLDMGLENIIDRCLAKDPAMRPANAGVLKAELEDLADQGAGFSSLHPDAVRPAFSLHNKFVGTVVKKISSTLQYGRGRKTLRVFGVILGILLATAAILFGAAAGLSTLTDKFDYLHIRDSRLLFAIAGGLCFALLFFSFVRRRFTKKKRLSTGISLDPAPCLGATDSPVTIVEFGDLSSRATRKQHRTLNKIMTRYKGQIRLIWKNFPDFAKSNPTVPAQALREAYVQDGNNGFWRLHRRLLVGSGKITLKQIGEYTGLANLDVEKMMAALNSGTHRKQVKKEITDARLRGVGQTQTLIVNDILYKTPMSYTQLSKVVAGILARRTKEADAQTKIDQTSDMAVDETRKMATVLEKIKETFLGEVAPKKVRTPAPVNVAPRAAPREQKLDIVRNGTTPPPELLVHAASNVGKAARSVAQLFGRAPSKPGPKNKKGLRRKR